MDKVHIVCPGISDLEEDCKKDIRCPVPGCGKILPQKQSLKFHVVKVHGIIKVLKLFQAAHCCVTFSFCALYVSSMLYNATFFG